MKFLRARLAGAKLFVARLVDEAAMVFVATFGVTLASGGALDKAAVLSAAVAGGRAVLGLLVKKVGADKDKPSVVA